MPERIVVYCKALFIIDRKLLVNGGFKRKTER